MQLFFLPIFEKLLKLLLYKWYVRDIINMFDFFRIFVASRNTWILIESNFWLKWTCHTSLSILKSIVYLAKSSFRSLTSSSAVHWSDRDVKPQISANSILEKSKIIVLQLNFTIRELSQKDSWNLWFERLLFIQQTL